MYSSSCCCTMLVLISSIAMRHYLNFNVFIRQFLLLLGFFPLASLLLSALSFLFLPLSFLFKLSSSPLLSLLFSYPLLNVWHNKYNSLHFKRFTHTLYIINCKTVHFWPVFQFSYFWCIPVEVLSVWLTTKKDPEILALGWNHFNLESCECKQLY